MTFLIPVSQRACCAIRLPSFDWTNPGCLLASLASYYGKKYCAHIFPWQNELLTFWGLLRTKGDTCSDKTVDPADWVTLCVCVLEEIRGRQKAALPVRPVSNIQTKHRRHCVNAAIPVCMQSPELCDCVWKWEQQKPVCPESDVWLLKTTGLRHVVTVINTR